MQHRVKDCYAVMDWVSNLLLSDAYDNAITLRPESSKQRGPHGPAGADLARKKLPQTALMATERLQDYLRNLGMPQLAGQQAGDFALFSN